MTVRTITRSDRDLFYARLKELHGHRCPMSVMGARLGLAALARVGRHGADGDVRALYRHRTCALDGIQLALGTTLGNNNLAVEEAGEHLLAARNLATGRAVTVRLTDEALALGRRYGEMRRAGGDPGAMEAILRELEEREESEVVTVEENPA